MFLLLTLNIFHTFFYCFYCWLWTSKCQLGKTYPRLEMTYLKVLFWQIVLMLQLQPTMFWWQLQLIINQKEGCKHYKTSKQITKTHFIFDWGLETVGYTLKANRTHLLMLSNNTFSTNKEIKYLSKINIKIAITETAKGRLLAISCLWKSRRIPNFTLNVIIIVEKWKLRTSCIKAASNFITKYFPLVLLK